MSDSYRPQLATLGKATTSRRSLAPRDQVRRLSHRLRDRQEGRASDQPQRQGLDARLSSIAEAAKKLKTRDAIIDGEVAMVMPDGRTSFAALQQAAAGTASHTPLVYFVFDLLRLDGERLDRLPLEERKARLRALVEPASPKPKAKAGARRSRRRGRIRYAEHIVGERRHVVRARRQHRSRRDHLQTPRSALSARAARQLAEIQGHTARRCS